MADETELPFTVHLPEDLLADVNRICNARNLSPGDLVRMYLRSFVAAEHLHTLVGPQSVMPLGKYRGESAEIVIKSDPHYIVWLLENVETFSLDEEAHALLETVLTDPQE